MTTATTGTSTPGRVRKALRDDALTAAQAYASLPQHQQTPEALAEARNQAQPWLDFCAVSELLRPADIDVWDSGLANDNHNSGFAVEYRHDFRPSEERMIQAYADGLRSFVRTSRDQGGKVERFEGGIHYHADDDAVTIGGRSSTGRFYGLHFHCGALVYFGQNGRREWVLEEQSDPRGPDADNDNYDPSSQAKTTVAAGAHSAIFELERVRRAEEVIAAAGAESVRLVNAVFQADTFAEIAAAAGLNATSNNGRRVAVKTLREISELIAA